MARKRQREPELVSVTLPWHRWNDLAMACDKLGTADYWFVQAAKTIRDRIAYEPNHTADVTVEGREATFTRILNAKVPQGSLAARAAALLAAELSTAAFGKAG